MAARPSLSQYTTTSNHQLLLCTTATVLSLHWFWVQVQGYHLFMSYCTAGSSDQTKRIYCPHKKPIVHAYPVEFCMLCRIPRKQTWLHLACFRLQMYLFGCNREMYILAVNVLWCFLLKIICLPMHSYYLLCSSKPGFQTHRDYIGDIGTCVD